MAALGSQMFSAVIMLPFDWAKQGKGQTIMTINAGMIKRSIMVVRLCKHFTNSKSVGNAFSSIHGTYCSSLGT